MKDLLFVAALWITPQFTSNKIAVVGVWVITLWVLVMWDRHSLETKIDSLKSEIWEKENQIEELEQRVAEIEEQNQG